MNINSLDIEFAIKLKHQKVCVNVWERMKCERKKTNVWLHQVKQDKSRKTCLTESVDVKHTRASWWPALSVRLRAAPRRYSINPVGLNNNVCVSDVLI